MMSRVRPESCLLLAVLCGQATLAPAEMPPSFVSTDGALGSRLIPDRKVYREGEPVWLYLDAFNSGAEPVRMVTGKGTWTCLRATGGDGKTLGMTRPPNAKEVTTRTLSPGKQANMATFFVSGNDHAMFPPLPPGRYEAILFT